MPSLNKRGTGEGANSLPQVAAQRYEALLRLSEVLSQCRELEDLTTILAEELREFLAFLQFYIVLYNENSDEVERAVVGREKNIIATTAGVPDQELPSWHAYNTQEPFLIHDLDTDARVPAQLRKGVAAQGLEVGPLVFVPLTTPHRRLGALGMSGPIATVYTSEDVSFLQLIGRVVALKISDSFNLQQAEEIGLELERQNDRLQRTDRELREVIETIPCMAWSAMTDGAAEFFNRRWLDYAGLSADQARGTGWITALHPNDLKGLVDYWQGILASGRPGEFEARLRRFDGEYRWFLFRATPSLDDNGKVVKWYGTNTDIEERKRAEQDLRRSETYLAQAQRVANIGSWVFDTVRMQPVYLSAEWLRLWDFDPKDGMPTWEQRLQRIHPEDRARYEGAFNRAIADKSDLDAEFRILPPDSAVRYIRSVGHHVLDALGEVTQMLGVVMDVTESRLAEQEHERLRQELAHISHLNRVSTIGELTASLAHEIKQPIGAAVTNAQACLRFLDGSRLDLIEAREAASEMVSDARRAADIIDRVRSLYRQDSSHQEMVDVNDLIREMIVMLRDEANLHSVTTRSDLAEGLPKMIADRVQLQQALMNLMLNGIEAMRDTTGELSIKSQLAENSQLLISVTDTGVGLPNGKVDQIFNAFFTTKPHGTGLGLAITRSIVESHGGRVWAIANVARGTTFHFTLPVRTTVSA
jgi:PAS domain S-box-containing protein